MSSKTDLVSAMIYRYHCGECAKYVGRVYSVSGMDKRFPKLPDYIKENARHCGIVLHPFLYPMSCLFDPYTLWSFFGDDIIKVSNRPYIDRRPQEWRDGYECMVRKTLQREFDDINMLQAKNEYSRIVKTLPEIAPKSLVGYVKMKRSGTANFHALKDKAASAGIDIKALKTVSDK